MKMKADDIVDNEDKQMTKDNQKNQSKKKEIILLVEDELPLGKSIAAFLEEHGYSVIVVIDGLEAFQIFKQCNADLVITDMLLPGLHGIELIRLIKDEDSAVPIIGISAVYKLHDDMQELFKMGVAGFIEKPISFKHLLNLIKDVLQRSELQKKIHYYKNLYESLTKENKILKMKLERILETKGGGLLGKEIEKYRAICGVVTHGLKSEFMHIGYSLKEIRESDNTSQEVIDESDMIGRSLEYSRVLLQRLLNFLDMGSLQEEPIEPLELIKKTEVLVTPRLPSNIQLQIKITQNMEDVKIAANFEQLMGVLLELINNASQVLRQKGGTIEIKLEEKNNNAAISIKDNGPGIPVKLREKILKEQVPSKSGLGLGLYLCSKVITEFGGQLKMLTASGKGTTFTIVLPKIRDKKES